MNIYAYTLDSLRELIRRLQKENAELRLQLKNAEQNKAKESIFENNYEVEPEYDEDQGGRIISRYITADMATAFFTLFWGRQDVYAKQESLVFGRGNVKVSLSTATRQVLQTLAACFRLNHMDRNYNP